MAGRFEVPSATICGSEWGEEIWRGKRLGKGTYRFFQAALEAADYLDGAGERVGKKDGNFFNCGRNSKTFKSEWNQNLSNDLYLFFVSLA